MTSEELAEFVTGEVERLRTRIMGVGKDQYEDGDEQLFETMPLEQLFEYAREELDDIVVYALMTKIRLNRLEQQIRKAYLNE